MYMKCLPHLGKRRGWGLVSFITDGKSHPCLPRRSWWEALRPMSGGIRSSRWAIPGLGMTNGTIGSELVNEPQRDRIHIPFTKKLTHEPQRGA